MTNDDALHDVSAEGESLATEGAALVAVSALMAERRRYEGWITALEARRGMTAAHVLERVHLDYTTRLEAVIVQLTSHADDLRRELKSLASRLGVLTSEQQRAEDERAEAELRAHVGELSAEDWALSAAASDVTLSSLMARRGEVEQELARTRELLDSTVRPAAKAVVDDRASRPVQAVEDTSIAGSAAAESSLPMELPPAVIAAEQQLLDIEERPARSAALLDESVDSGAPSPEPPAVLRRSAGFDELAFLSSVVDTPAGAFDAAPADQPDEKSRRDTFARRSEEDAIVSLGSTTPLDSSVIEKEGDPPLAAPTGGGSAVGRDSAVDGVKSLKCGECSALNYPTEWYCERCGAELASL
jgi:hypothetical protein